MAEEDAEATAIVKPAGRVELTGLSDKGRRALDTSEVERVVAGAARGRVPGRERNAGAAEPAD